MAMFRRKSFSGQDRQLGLLTCVVSARKGNWEVFWVGEGGPEPQGFTAATLTDATQQAADIALAFYPLAPQQGAELQFAFYPWDYGKDAAMYDISGVAGKFRAKDIQGSDLEVASATLEGLVEAVRGQPGGDKAMLRWIVPFAELPIEVS